MYILPKEILEGPDSELEEKIWVYICPHIRCHDKIATCVPISDYIPRRNPIRGEQTTAGYAQLQQ